MYGGGKRDQKGNRDVRIDIGGFPLEENRVRIGCEMPSNYPSLSYWNNYLIVILYVITANEK